MAKSISIEHLFKVFGKEPEQALALARQGLAFGFGTIQRFFARHAITRKKRQPMPRSRTGPTS